MSYTGYSVYDDKVFFESYQDRRRLANAPNNLIEQPIIDELVGDVSGKTILDIGCGDGTYGVKLLQLGATSYHGIDGSQNMTALAQKHLSKYNANIVTTDIENFKTQHTYDIVISRLVLHYIENLAPLFQKIYYCLKDNGNFVFSVEHPVITSNYESYHKKGKRSNWIVDNYFNTGERINTWHGKQVVKYHKTLQDYWDICKRSNFDILALSESKPVEVNFKNHDEYIRRQRIPLFLIMQLKKKSINHQ